MQDRARLWISRLIERPGISVLATSSPTARHPTPAPSWSCRATPQNRVPPPPAWVATCTARPDTPPRLSRDLSGPTELPINVLEFVAIFGNFATFGSGIPSALNCHLLALTDSLTSALIVAHHSARAPLMQLVHLRLLALPNFQRLAPTSERSLTSTGRPMRWQMPPAVATSRR